MLPDPRIVVGRRLLLQREARGPGARIAQRRPLAHRERDEGWSMVLPDRILIFRGPLERWCTSREELEEEITVTVIHEVAHHFGIPDERLHELGWE